MTDPITKAGRAIVRLNPMFRDDVVQAEREAAAAERERLQQDARDFHRVVGHAQPFNHCQTAQCAALQAMLWRPITVHATADPEAPTDE